MRKARTVHMTLRSGQAALSGRHSSNARCTVTPRFHRSLIVTDKAEEVTCKKCLASINRKA